MELGDPRTAGDGDAADDGLRGAAGERFARALGGAGRELGFGVATPAPTPDDIVLGRWVDEAWHGRQLTIRQSTHGRHAPTTGPRWVVVQLSTARLGAWTRPPLGAIGDEVGVDVPLTGHRPRRRDRWRGEAPLAADLWAFTARLGEPTPASGYRRHAVLQAQSHAVRWQLRAAEVDAGSLAEAVRLLERVADFVERRDADLTARHAAGTSRSPWRRAETAYAVALVALLLLVVGSFVLLGLLGLLA